MCLSWSSADIYNTLIPNNLYSIKARFRAKSLLNSFSQIIAFAGLFKDKKAIICEKELSSDFALKRALMLYKLLGMSVLYMSAEDHDKHIAYVSHLTHVIAYALSLTVQEIEKNEEKKIFEMAGSGFASTVRIAKSSSAMWTPIFRQNARFLTKSIDTYIDVLNHFKQLIAEDRTDELYNEIKEANRIKDVLKG